MLTRTNTSDSSDICGTCTACCKLLGIGSTLRGEPFRKPAGVWCPHCAIGKGCKVYAERPQVCRDFECLYLQGQLRGENLDPDLRPDRCGVVLSATTDPNILAASVDAHKADRWRRGKIFDFIRKIVAAGFKVTVSTGNTERKLLLRKRGNAIEIGEEEFTLPDEKGMQWSIPETYRARERIQ